MQLSGFFTETTILARPLADTGVRYGVRNPALSTNAPMSSGHLAFQRHRPDRDITFRRRRLSATPKNGMLYRPVPVSGCRGAVSGGINLSTSKE